MTIFVDQCVNRDLVETLKAKGVTVITAAEAGLARANDIAIFDYAIQHGHILLTFDKDFGNILRFDVKASQGIVIVYIEEMSKEEIIKNTFALLDKFSLSQMQGKLLIVDKAKIKIWKG